MVLALVAKRNEKWFAYGVRQGSKIGPRVEIDLEHGSDLILTVHEEGVDTPITAGLRLHGPSESHGRPRLSLRQS